MAEEIELKLVMTPRALAKMRRNPVLKSLGQSRARGQTLESTYFDTPDHDLKAAGQALRIRTLGAKRIQTLKSPAPKARRVSGAQHFLEFESEIEGDKPDLSLIADETIRSALEASGVAGRLEPLFETRFKRSKLPVRLADSEIEVCFDEGVITNGEAETPICEMELELISGQPHRLYELALMLCEAGVFRQGQETKAARGFALADPVEPEPIRSNRPTLSKTMTARDVLRVCAGECLTQIRGNEAAVYDGADPEGVHQMRVAVRRLRALVSCFKPLLTASAQRFLSNELRWLQNSLGGARDWDVFIEETLTPLKARVPGEASLEDLMERARALREQAYKAAHDSLDDPRYTRLLLQLQLWLADGSWIVQPERGASDPAAKSANAFAASVLRKRSRTLLKMGKKRKKLSEAQYHEIRIAAKKLRYAVEFFETLFPKASAKAYRTRVMTLQETLGSLNDAIVGHRLLDEIEAVQRKQEGAADGLTVAIGMTMGWQAAKIESDLSSFEAAWKDFEKRKSYWS